VADVEQRCLGAAMAVFGENTARVLRVRSLPMPAPMSGS